MNARRMTVGAISVILSVCSLAFAAVAGPLEQCQAHIPWGIPDFKLTVNVVADCRPGYFALQDIEYVGPRIVAEHLTANSERAAMSMIGAWPQLPGLDRDGWENLEIHVRRWAQSRGELIVYAGPILSEPGKEPTTIGANHVAVPVAFWTVAVDPVRQEAIGIAMTNSPTPKGDLRPFIAKISEIEEEAQITLPMPSAIDKTERSRGWDDGPPMH